MTNETTIYYYTYLSPVGPVALLPEGGGRFKILVAHENLGSFASLEDAFAAAVTGQTSVAWSGGDLADLDLPGNLDDWQQKVFARVKRLRP